ncbi:LEA type 2 family protein [Bdellovibrio svalbardensis]|uniref:LEA type 2 family protein n=1 Tax=Bdellovibrio svalbardensis TaxID=2972972 RepID=A0ABT6DI34_9BACT|nr:LEA type 2 family protein [Bdellovibrio svalbardensis]MDG0816510.1 LEA type 2 family protein [Bdellovibrio svalbardensis]
MRLIAILMASFVLNGCAFFKERYAQKPDVSLQEVHFQDPQFLSATLVFVLLVKNPNKIDLNVSEITYEIQLDGQSFAKAKIDKKITIAAESSNKVAIPLRVEYLKVFHGMKEILSGKDLSYLIVGEAKVSGFSVPFKEEGRVSLKDFEK